MAWRSFCTGALPDDGPVGGPKQVRVLSIKTLNCTHFVGVILNTYAPCLHLKYHHVWILEAYVIFIVIPYEQCRTEGVGGVQPPPPRNSEVLTKSNRIAN